MQGKAEVTDGRQVTMYSEKYSEHSGMRCLGEIIQRVVESGCGPVVIQLNTLTQVQGHACCLYFCIAKPSLIFLLEDMLLLCRWQTYWRTGKSSQISPPGQSGAESASLIVKCSLNLYQFKWLSWAVSHDDLNFHQDVADSIERLRPVKSGTNYMYTLSQCFITDQRHQFRTGATDTT